jgi:hypothetical protein
MTDNCKTVKCEGRRVIKWRNDQVIDANLYRSMPDRIAVLQAGRVTLHLQLHQARTAELIWSALPLHSIVENRGDSIHFDAPMKTGRQLDAKLNVSPGDVCFWTEDERVVLAWGSTPISRPKEVRLTRPCNIWAKAIDDPAALAVVTSGERWF